MRMMIILMMAVQVSSQGLFNVLPYILDHSLLSSSEPHPIIVIIDDGCFIYIIILFGASN